MKRLGSLLAETRAPRIEPGAHKAELRARLRAMAVAGDTLRHAWPLPRYAAALAAAAALVAVVLARTLPADTHAQGGGYSVVREFPELARPDLVIPGLEGGRGRARVPRAMTPLPEMTRLLAHRLRDDADPSRAVWSPD